MSPEGMAAWRLQQCWFPVLRWDARVETCQDGFGRENDRMVFHMEKVCETGNMREDAKQN